ncbi:MAG: hypothetical protein ACFNQH_01330 [Veillonella parvula]
MEDLTGKQFNYLTVIGFSHKEKQGLCTQYYWNCKCVCGKVIKVTRNSLMRGRKSCGCMNNVAHCGSSYHGGVVTHGDSKKRIYRIYRKILERCYFDKKSKYYKNGIGVCDDWKNDYLKFREWSYNNGYTDELTIDRIDNEKGYSPDNCRWVTKKEQQNNKSNNVLITFNGETHTISQWADKLGWTYTTLANRHKRKWSVEDMLTKIPKYIK